MIHGGDLLFRSRVPSGLVTRAFEPLRQVADRGVPVVVVPGNHERSFLPRPLVADHQLIHILNAPGTACFEALGVRVGVSGFPFDRQVRKNFRKLLVDTHGLEKPNDIRLLCLHQAVESCRVGPVNPEGRDFTFRDGQDVVRGADIPPGFAAVLSGHIHRHQVLHTDLLGRPLAAPVLYPGSVERTSAAERDEEKGYLVLEIVADGVAGGRLDRWRFVSLPTRPMFQIALHATGLDADSLSRKIQNELAELPADSIVGLKIVGEVSESAGSVLGAASLRSLAPKTMNVALKGAWQLLRRPAETL